MRKLLATIWALPVLAATLTAADVSGVWNIEFEPEGGDSTYIGECSFKQEGQKLTGSCVGGVPGSAPLPLTGEVKSRTVTFQYNTGLGEGVTVSFLGELDEAETSMSGSWRFVDRDGNKGGGKFTASKH